MSLFKDGSELEKIQEALIDAFDHDSLNEMLRFKLGKKLNQIVSPNQNFQVTVFQLLTNWAEPRDLTIKLINAAHQANPTNQLLLRVAQRYELGVGLYRDGKSQDQRDVEKVIKKLNNFIDIDVWMKKCGETEVRVCRIIGQAGPIGTGFLVGPGVVMTNDHVAQDSVFQNNPESIVCQFDYKKINSTTLNPGQEYKLKAENWLIAFSPNEKRKKGQFTDNPGIDTLDYALLHLEQKPGKKSLINPGIEEKESERGWFRLSATPYDFKPNSPLIILQHPEGDSLKMAIETQAIQGMTSNGVMVKYNTNTMPGSSGSPCFDLDWNLIALHHSGAEEYNGGTPISLIVEDLKQQLGDQKMKEVLGLDER
jgi:hypothetical protein